MCQRGGLVLRNTGICYMWLLECGCLGCCAGACKQVVMVEAVSILYVEVLEGGLEVVLCG